MSFESPHAVIAALQQEAAARLLAEAPVLEPLARLFLDAGHELAVVGGPVRDALLGRLDAGLLADLDLTTTATPDQILAIVEGWADTHWDIGRDFGTIGLRKGPATIEITTYRSDSYDPSSRKPQVRFGTRLEDDLARRDLTVNAMAIRLPGLEFVDPHGGTTDLARGLLRTPIDPEISFGDDPLRMMRVARFASQLRFHVEPGTRQAMTDMAQRLSIVSVERITAEFSKLIVGAEPRRGVEILVDTGLADQFIPELVEMRRTVDEHKRHKDVYEHSLTVLDQAVALEGRSGPDDPVPGPDLVLRLAALLHDIGKPSTRRFEKNGGVSFHHHEVVGAQMVAKRLKVLRFDRDTVRAVARLVELHLRFHGYAEGEWTDSAVRRYVTDAGPLLERLHLLTRADCTTRNRRKAARLREAYDSLEHRIADLREREEIAAIRPDLDGTRIMQILQIPPGRVVGRAYQHLLGLRMEHGPLGEERAGQELLAWWAQQPESGEQPAQP